MKSPDAEDYCVAVIGAGAMGQGIAQVSVMGGMRVVLFDKREGGAEAARETICGRLDRLVEKGRQTAEEAEAQKRLLQAAASLDDIAPADTVVEAVFEDLDVKHQVFKEIEAVVRPDCIVASNTSSIPISSIARVCEHRSRVAGLHFFNPVPLMRLVEVIVASETEDRVVAHLTALGKRMGRTPVTVKDATGFLVNLGGRAYTTEGLRMAHEGVATPAQIDAILRDGCAFRMGPFELMDLTGVDVNFPVSLIVYDGYMQDPRIKTSPYHKALFDAGRYGRKTGRGNFDYDDKGNMIDPPSPDHETDAEPADQVTLAEPDERLAAFCQEVGLTLAADDAPDRPILAAPFGEDCTHVAVRTGADFRRLVAVDLSYDWSKRVTVMTAPGADLSVRDRVAARIAAAGPKVTAIADSPGFVAQRMRAMVGNLGCYIAEVGLAEPADIDLGLKLGLNYPLGPLEIVDTLGPRTTLAIMEHLQAITGEDRYRPSLWLKRRALLDLPIHTPA